MSEKKSGFNKSFQRIQLCGRLVKDPETRFLEDGTQVTNFSLAINRKNSQNADFIPCVAWKSKAKTIADNLVKGDLILVEGELRSSSYQDGENRKQFTIQFEVSSDSDSSKLIFMESKKNEVQK